MQHIGSIIFMSISKRLKAERERLELSQPQFGELTGVGKTTVINWEKGASAPDAVQLAAIAAAKADVLYILTGQRSQPISAEALLPVDERIMLDNYRHAPGAVQAGIKTTLGAFAPAIGAKRAKAG